jgi:hypothetical protein
MMELLLPEVLSATPGKKIHPFKRNLNPSLYILLDELFVIESDPRSTADAMV